jgi:glycosyltransferase involved in cell wall biosynthesis
VILEAWSHGKPVIGANAGGLADLITEEETGLLVPFGDSFALADGIERLLTDESLASRLGLNGHRAVVERYTWDHTYRRLLGIYESVLAGCGRATQARTM